MSENGLRWLMRKDQCMHCTEPGCLVACPAPGAIVQYTNGIVDFQQDQCIGCGYCMSGCPFNVPKFSQKTRRVYKCTLCVDRTSVGLQPACVKACPTSCLQFGTKEQMLEVAQKRVDQLRDNGFAQAGVYDPPASAAPASSRCWPMRINPSSTDFRGTRPSRSPCACGRVR